MIRPRDLPLVLVLRREVRRVRTAVTERDAEALRAPHRDVRAPLARRRQQRQREEVRRRRDQRPGRVGPVTELAVVDDLAVRRRVLHQRAEDLRPELEAPVVADRDLDPPRPRTRPHHLDRLRVAPLRDEEDRLPLAPLHRPAHRHRLGRRRRLVQQRRVRDRQPRQVDDHRLEGQQRLETPLRDLRLVRRVRRVPPRVLQDVAQDHRRGDRVVVPHPEVRPVDPVLRRDRPQLREHLVLRQRLRQVQRTTQPDRLRDRRVDQRIERVVAEELQHPPALVLRRAEVPALETVRVPQTARLLVLHRCPSYVE